MYAPKDIFSINILCIDFQIRTRRSLFICKCRHFTRILISLPLPHHFRMEDMNQLKQVYHLISLSKNMDQVMYLCVIYVSFTSASMILRLNFGDCSDCKRTVQIVKRTVQIVKGLTVRIVKGLFRL